MTFANGLRDFLYLRRVLTITSGLLKANDRIILMTNGLRIRLSLYIRAILLRLACLGAIKLRLNRVTYLVREGARHGRRYKASTPVVVRSIPVLIMR